MKSQRKLRNSNNFREAIWPPSFLFITLFTKTVFSSVAYSSYPKVPQSVIARSTGARHGDGAIPQFTININNHFIEIDVKVPDFRNNGNFCVNKTWKIMMSRICIKTKAIIFILKRMSLVLIVAARNYSTSKNRNCANMSGTRTHKLRFPTFFSGRGKKFLFHNIIFAFYISCSQTLTRLSLI